VSDDALVEVAVAEAALGGQLESGDAHLVAPFPEGVLVAAVDGLGHGSEAAHAARLACSALEEDPGGDLQELFARAHARLRRSRGVAMSLASFDRGGSLTWLGVGNVEGTLVRVGDTIPRDPESILLRGGVVGYQLPKLRPSATEVGPGDTLVFATDGVAGAHRRQVDPATPPGLLADRLLGEFGKEADDALVLVARYAG
jgi:negative regulator of sigma-B (phosphoserine phosphatase)